MLARRGRRGVPGAARHDRGEPRGGRRPHATSPARRSAARPGSSRSTRWSSPLPRARGARRGRRRQARAAAGRRRRLHAALAGLRAGAFARRAARRPRAAGRRGGGDDPGLAGGRARRHAAGAAGEGDRRLERRGRARRGRRTGDRRRAGGLGRLACAVRDQRAGRAGDPGRARARCRRRRAAGGCPTRSAHCCSEPASAPRRSGSPRARSGAGATRARSAARRAALAAVVARSRRSLLTRGPRSRRGCGARGSSPPRTSRRCSTARRCSRGCSSASCSSSRVWGYTPLEAGLSMTPGAIVAAVVALRAGRSSRARGRRR